MADHGYGRPTRIRRRAEFLVVQNGATSRIRTASLLVLVRRRDPGAGVDAGAALPTRLGVVASRRIGGAVLRNRAKRLIREAFRRGRAQLPTGLDVVVIANASAPTRSLAEIDRELAKVGRDLRRALGDRPVAGRRPVG